MGNDWTTIAKLTQEAFRAAANDWITHARIQGGQVKGPAAILTPGSLVSDSNIETTMMHSLVSSQVPPAIAMALAHALGTAWDDWAAGFQVRLPSAYPSFAAFPGPAAPPTHVAQPASVSLGESTGEASLKAPVLASKLGAALRAHSSKGHDRSLEQAIQNLTTWIDRSFTEWKGLAKIAGLVGQGHAPTFAPPYVPVAPVTIGENLSVGPLFAGPRFGRVEI